ncbi:MAG: DNA gyrase modulator, partial [Phycisphaerae bacterium]|nr:DNA gyrase modulator [Phycisphaerae bacterium]
MMQDIAQQICDEARRRGARFADVRVVRSNSESIRVQDGRADMLASGYSCGMCVRVLAGRSWGFASADAANKRQAEKCLDEALGLAKASADFVAEDAVVADLEPAEATLRAEPRIPPQAMPVRDKIKTLLAWERVARETGGGKVVNSVVAYADGLQEQLLVNTAGCIIRSENVRAVATAFVTASDGTILQRALEQKAIVGGAELLVDTEPEQLPILAAKKVLGLLDAKVAPAGRFTVVFHPSITGL